MNVERQHEQGRSCTPIHWMQTVTDLSALRTFVPQTVVKIGTNVTLAPPRLERWIVHPEIKKTLGHLTTRLSSVLGRRTETLIER